MAEAVQRTAARPAPRSVPLEGAVEPPAPAPRSLPAAKNPPTKTENLQALAFKVPPAFRKRFRQRAANADLKLNELLFAALDAWEEKHKV